MGSGGGGEVDVGVVGCDGGGEGLRARAEGGAGEFGVEERFAGVEDVGVAGADLNGGDIATAGVVDNVERAVADVPVGVAYFGDGNAGSGRKARGGADRSQTSGEEKFVGETGTHPGIIFAIETHCHRGYSTTHQPRFQYGSSKGRVKRKIPGGAVCERMAG